MTKPPPFTRVSGLAAALAEENIDTDIIFPARFLLITARKGLGRYVFHDRRFAADGNEIAQFVLNRESFRNAPFLVTGANFGSGSSREQAVWALLDRGIRCIVAPSFGEIFRANCMRNGLLPVTLPSAIVDRLQSAATDQALFAVNLESQTLTIDGGEPLRFSMSPERRLAMLNGWDETEQILNRHGDAIHAFEAKQRHIQPWLYKAEDS